LNREIEQHKQRLTELETAATSKNSKIAGLPHIKGIADKTALAADIADIKTIIETKSTLCLVEYNRLMRYISGIEDSFMRQILALRHINGLSWRQVAASIGGGNTEISVRVAHSRFLRNQSL
jgi:hypothetical protein